jgi:ATP-binding cassette subfamily F protein 3
VQRPRAEPATADSPTPPSRTGESKPAARRLSQKELRKLRTEVGRLEEEVARLEARQAELVAELENPDTYTVPGKAQHLNRELTTIVDQIQAATEAWEEAARRLEAAS